MPFETGCPVERQPIAIPTRSSIHHRRETVNVGGVESQAKTAGPADNPLFFLLFHGTGLPPTVAPVKGFQRRAAKAAQAQRFVVVSSAGADPAAKNFYLRTKGEMEEALQGVGFASLDILQPGLLLGWRGHIRPVELLGAVIMPLVNPFLTGKREHFRAIPAQTVAAAVHDAAAPLTR